MIYTVTLNPALDYVVWVDELNTGKVNRTESEKIFPGGKGINVSIVLKNMGYDSLALGFVAGFTGNQLIRELQQREIRSDFISVDGGMTRINVKIKGKNETEINGRGPEVSPLAVQVLILQMERLKAGDVLILSGSVPASFPEDIYEKLMERLMGYGVRIIVDTTGECLLRTLKYRPFLIKPNIHELGEVFGVTLEEKSEVIAYGKKLQEMGARNVLVSMAGSGAVLVAEDGSVYQSEAPKGKVRHSVGAGDSMVAGFLAGYLEAQNYENAFYMGLCTGSASAFSEELATKEEVMQLLHECNQIFGKK